MGTPRFLICFLLGLTLFSAYAFERPFPAAAKRGTMAPAIYPAITIDGKLRTLSVAARIWNEDNLIEQPVSLRGTDYVVNYTENQQGEIDRVWILNKDEAHRSLTKKDSQ